MTPSFILAAAVMLAAALGFTLWPLLRERGSARPLATSAALAVALPAAAIGIYLLVGAPAGLHPEARAPQPAAAALDVESAVAQLQAHLEANPGDLQGWPLLGRALEALGRYPEAADAWARAARLAPDEPDILVGAAEARALPDPQRHIDDQGRAWLERAVALVPGHQRGLWLLGVSDYQRGEFAAAIDTWERLLAQLDATANPQVAAAISDQIERARGELAPPQEPTASGDPPATGSAAARP